MESAVKFELLELKCFLKMIGFGGKYFHFSFKWGSFGRCGPQLGSCESQDWLEKGVLRAAHPHTPFSGKCPPPSRLHTSAYNSIMVWSRASSNKLVEKMAVKGLCCYSILCSVKRIIVWQNDRKVTSFQIMLMFKHIICNSIWKCIHPKQKIQGKGYRGSVNFNLINSFSVSICIPYTLCGKYC